MAEYQEWYNSTYGKLMGLGIGLSVAAVGIGWGGSCIVDSYNTHTSVIKYKMDLGTERIEQDRLNLIREQLNSQRPEETLSPDQVHEVLMELAGNTRSPTTLPTK